MSKESLKKGMLIVLLANIVNLSISLLRGFLFPRYLSINTYAEIKTYQLYLSYLGVGSLGFVDGMYLKYGGIKVDEIDPYDFNTNLSTMRLFQLCLAFTVIVLAALWGDYLLFCLGFSLFFQNMIDYYKMFYQATGEFSHYSNIMNVSAVGTLLVCIILLFVVKEESPRPYIFSMVCVSGVVWALLEFIMQRRMKTYRFFFKFSLPELKYCISTGFVLMFGVLLSTLMMGMDRWCVKLWMTTYDFALYSFAASMVGFLSYGITPVSVTLYNFFCNNEGTEKLNEIRKVIVLFVTTIVACAFPIKLIIELLLSKYASSISIIFILFASQVVYGLITCFYVNLYKAQKKQRNYFMGVVVVCITGLLLNVVSFFLLFKRIEMFSLATLLAGFVWLVICNIHFPDNAITKNELLYILCSITMFIVLGVACNSIVGCILYFVGLFLFSMLFMRGAFFSALGYIKRNCDGKKRRIGRN